jgi:hypothetical protein
VGVVHVHVVHPILAAHSTQGIEGASETSKQERAMSQNCLEKKRWTKKWKICFVLFFVFLCTTTMEREEEEARRLNENLNLKRIFIKHSLTS